MGKILQQQISKATPLTLVLTKTRYSSSVSSSTSSSRSSSSSRIAPTAEQIRELILESRSPSQALHTFRWASSTFPTSTLSLSSFRALVHVLCRFRRFHSAFHLLDHIPLSLGSPPDDSIFLTLIRGLSRARLAPLSIQVLDLVHNSSGPPSLKIFNSILDALVRHDIDLARRFYRDRMMRIGLRGDAYTFAILMKGLCLTNRIADAFKLLQIIKSTTTSTNATSAKPNNTILYNTLLHALCRNGKVGRARSLMNELEEPNDVTFNLMISAYAKDHNLVQSLVMLENCFSSGFIPHVVSITKVVELLCNAGRVNEAVDILERVENEGGVVDVLAYNTLLKGFCKFGKVRVACRFLKEMERKGCLPNVDTYNVLISGFCDHGMLDLALEMFYDIKTDGIAWNFVTFDTLIRGLFSGGRIEDGFKVLDLMEEMNGGCGGRISPYNSVLYGLYRKHKWDEALEFLVKMKMLFPRAVDRSLKILGFCQEGSMENAKRVYDQMNGEGGIPSVIVFDCLVHGFCQQGQGREAAEVMNEMVGHGYYPLVSTLNAVVSGICREGKEGSAVKLVEDLMERGCVADAGTYVPVIDSLCCSEGKFDKAVRVLLQMVERNVIPDHAIWNSLLHRLGEEAMWFDRKGLLRVIQLIEWIVQT